MQMMFGLVSLKGQKDLEKLQLGYKYRAEMACQVEQIADCGDISSLARALFINDKDDTYWLSQCSVSLSPCGNLLAVGYRNRLCILISQWISSSDSNSFLISWSGTLPSEITVVLSLAICPSHQSSQNGPDWFCIIVGFRNGHVGFYTNTGHLLLLEKLEDKPVMRISCHTGTYGTLPDDIHVLYQNCQCIIAGSSLFQLLRNAKAHLAKVDSRNLSIKKWIFTEQETINDAAVVGLELKNTYDHLLAASTYGGYDVWYRSVPPMNSLILGAGVKPYVSFHYALEGGTTPPLQDVARAVAHKIKSALPEWLRGSGSGGGNAGEGPAGIEVARGEALALRGALCDAGRHAVAVAISPDRRLAAITDSYGRVALLDLARGHLIRLIKGCRDAQCAFIQIFEDSSDNKPQLSTIKDIKRAIFLIIYNPKKGLIDIRIMQRGNRVAVFTATKNGQLLYNTCGLVGAEKNYTTKKLNLPEFQCVLIDPDGKLKKVHIPFFYALEGEHSQKSKDLQTLREFRDSVKKCVTFNDENSEDLLTIVKVIKTLEIKKHCLDLLVRKYEVPPKFVMSCLSIFWDSLDSDDTQNLNTRRYLANLALLTMFYRQINNESVEDMQELIIKIKSYFQNDNVGTYKVNFTDEVQEEMFHLLEDDNCILERLLTLAQEKDYKEQQHARVKFADNNASSYKDYIACFNLEGISTYITLRNETSSDKICSLATITFKCIFRMNNLNMLSEFIQECCIDPKEIVRLLIIQFMNMPIDEINIDIIEKFIAVLFYIGSVTQEATQITYNEISVWWQSIRDILSDMSCPLRSMIVAMACKAVAKIFESSSEKQEENEVWESVTAENAKWGILIGKLEDISILSIVLAFKDTFAGSPLPKLEVTEYNINLKYIYTRGRGSVTELIAKWLCGMGVLPEAIVANDLIEALTSKSDEVGPLEDEDSLFLVAQNNRVYVDENPKIFKWLSLLRRQFPLSTISDYIIANMCWEYAISWQKSVHSTDLLDAVLHCLTNILSYPCLKLGLFSIIWSTYIKHTFEESCRLVNKIGRLPKDTFCLQLIGSNNVCMVKFLEITAKYLEHFFKNSSMYINESKQIIEFEKIWDDNLPSLVEVAQNSKVVNNDILNLNYQIACTIYYQCHFNLKFSKPLDTLFDIDYQYVLEALTGHVDPREISMKSSDKVKNNRFKFLTKLIRSAVETISSNADNNGLLTTFNNEEYTHWIEKFNVLAELWNVESDFINRQQVIALYHQGYDSLTEQIIHRIENPDLIFPSILAITIQRLKRGLENSTNQPEWIVSVPPQLYKRMQNTVLDSSVPANPSLTTTGTALQNIVQHMLKTQKQSTEDVQNIKLAEIIIETCELLTRRKL